MNRTISQYKFQRWFTGLLAILLMPVGLMSCIDDSLVRDQSANDGEPVTIYFSTASQPEVVDLRADATTLSDLYLFLFDEHGGFITAVRANQSSGNTYSATLPASGKKRIIHFIGTNVPNIISPFVTPAKLSTYVGRSEGELIVRYTTQDLAYWCRQEIDGISQGKTLPVATMIRNQGRISFDVSGVQSGGVPFEFLGYTIHNRADRGTIAPFNGYTSKYEEGFVTEPPKVTFIPINPTSAVFTQESTDLFEREAASDSRQVFYLIVKARYNGQVCYYKLGLFDPVSLDRLPLVRNHHYVMRITKVSKRGYLSLTEAMSNPPASNADLATILIDYPKISDGINALEVDKMSFFITEGEASFSFNYRYTTGDGVVNNPVSVELRQEDSRKAIQEYEIHPGGLDPTGRIRTGMVTGKASGSMPNEGDIFKGVLKIRAGNLVREVRVYLSEKMKYRPNPTIEILGDMIDDEVKIHLSLPENLLDETLYPIYFTVESKFLYPNKDPGKNSNLTVISDGGGRYRYLYKAISPGDHTIFFKRNQSYKTEEILLGSDYFKTHTLPLTAAGGVTFLHARGPLSYWDEGTYIPVPSSARAIAYPTSMTSNFRLEGKGRYVFDINPVGNPDDFWNFRVELSDGRSYMTGLERSYFVNEQNEVKNPSIPIVLNAYRQLAKGYAKKQTSTGLSNIYASSVIEPSDGNVRIRIEDGVYEVEVPSQYPDSKQIILLEKDGDEFGPTISIAQVTAKDLRVGKTILFTGGIDLFLNVIAIDRAGNTYNMNSKTIGVSPGTLTPGYSQRLVLPMGTPISEPITFVYTVGSTRYTGVYTVTELQTTAQVILRTDHTQASLNTNVYYYDYQSGYDEPLPSSYGVQVVSQAYPTFNPELTMRYIGNDYNGNSLFRLNYPSDLPPNTILTISTYIGGRLYRVQKSIQVLKQTPSIYLE